MQVNIRDLKNLNSFLEIPILLNKEELTDVPLLEPVEGKIKITFHGDKFQIQGELYTVVMLNCSRCLDLFNYPLRLRLEEWYVQGQGPMEEGEFELDQEELSTFYFQGEILDLTAAIRENILVSLPWRPLCQDNCQGLCPSCGGNLNRVNCQCSEEIRKPTICEKGE